MQTHEDADASLPDDFMDRLEQRAMDTLARKASQIASGKDSEDPVDAWRGVGGIGVVKLPNDEQGILRISVGGGIPSEGGDYCSFRGNRLACAALLERAARSLREGHRFEANAS